MFQQLLLRAVLLFELATCTQTFSVSYENAKKFHGKTYTPQLPL